MTLDIHSYVERRNPDGGWEFVAWPSAGTTGPFEVRDGTVFAFLAGVGNLAGIPQLATPRGLPPDASAHVRYEYETWDADGHAHSWISVDELVDADYDEHFELLDTRTREPTGETATVRANLGGGFFADLLVLRRLNDQHPTRVVFWFDS